jgi:hypothetical protein
MPETTVVVWISVASLVGFGAGAVFEWALVWPRVFGRKAGA